MIGVLNPCPESEVSSASEPSTGSSTPPSEAMSSNPYDDYLGTRLIHIGSKPDLSTGAVIRPISLSTTYAQSAIGVHQGFEYSRSLNPNRLDLETLVASLEGVDTLSSVETSGLPLPGALAVSSGSAATATVINSLVGQGGHVVAMSDIYGGTYRYLTQVAPGLGIKHSFVDLSTADDSQETATQVSTRLERAILPGVTKLVWIETPTNPTLKLVDITRLAAVARAKGVLVAVDNTFLSPYYQQPIQLGADLVVHSATKYINGHSDVVLGLIISPHPELIERMRFLQNAHGAVPSAFDCWLAQRGLKTLELRMLRHGTNALAVANWLENVARVERGWVTKVIYPGLQGARKLAWRQIPPETREKLENAGYGPTSVDGNFPYGGMLSFRIRRPANDEFESACADRFLSGCRLFTLAESLGGVESLAELPSRMTHAGFSAEDKAAIGIDHGLIRLSVGIEDPRDLIKDIEQSLSRALASVK